MEASPPSPQDLTLPCHPRITEHRSETSSLRPGLAPQSALGSLPSVALSSAEVRTSVPKRNPIAKSKRKNRSHDNYRVR